MFRLPPDPTLFLGGTVDQKRLDILYQIAIAENEIDNASIDLNTYTNFKRKLKLIEENLLGIGFESESIIKNENDVNDKIKEFANSYADIQYKNQAEIIKLRQTLHSLNNQNELIVDFSKSDIKNIPISFDSLTLDARYFAKTDNTQSSDPSRSKIKDYTSQLLDDFDNKVQLETSDLVTHSVANQWENHNVTGTLIITAKCTHKNSAIIEPLYLDLDKTISIWNKYKTNQINVENLSDNNKSETNEETIDVISGANYGSSFIGMVHILKDSSTDISNITSYVSSNAKSIGDLNELLSSNGISSHINLITVGVMTDITSHKITSVTKEFTEFKPNKLVQKLGVLDIEKTSDAQKKLEQIEKNNIDNVLSSVKKIEDKENSILDTKSLLKALENYINEVKNAKSGAPTSFFIKNISRSHIIKLLDKKTKKDSD